MEKELLAVIGRVATHLGLKPDSRQVELSFRIYDAEDGGPGWMISATRAAKDRRKLDETFRGYGSTIEEAEMEIYDDVARR